MDQIGADDDGTGFESGEIPGAARFFDRDTKTHGDKSKGNSVINQHLKQLFIDGDKTRILQREQQKACQHCDWHQTLSDECDPLSEKIRKQNRACNHPKLNDEVPQCMIGRRIIHFIVPSRFPGIFEG